MTIRLKAVRHIGINVKNIEISKNFYEKYLGFQIVSDHKDDSEYINKLSCLEDENLRMIKMISKDLGLTIELVEYAKNKHSPHFLIFSEGIGHLAVQVEDADNTWEILKESGCHLLSKPLMSNDGYAKVFFCYDPNGFRIEFVELQNEKTRNNTGSTYST